MPSAEPSRYRRAWLTAFLGFFLLSAAWSLATPYDGAPDERDHMLRAYAVATGQIFLEPEVAALGGGAFVDAPRSLMVERCWQFQVFHDVSCSGSPGPDETIDRLPTSAGRSAPLYYAIVGGPLVLAPNWLGVILARLIGAALACLLLATALADALRWSRHGLLAAAVVAGTTPIVLQVTGALNPSALEITGAAAFFAAAVPLLLDPRARRDNSLLWHAGVAGIVLATTRMLGPVWIGLGVLVLLLPWRRAKLADLWAWRALRYWVLGIVAGGAAGALWTLLSSAAEPNSFFVIRKPLAYQEIVRMELQNWSRYVDQMVGINSWLDARIPEIGYIIWPIVGGSLVLLGYAVSDRANRLRLAAMTAVAILGPMTISVLLANTFGFITQGRYLLPLLIGVVMVAAFGLSHHLPAERARRALSLVVLTLLPIQLLALLFAMRRWQLGVGNGWNVLRGNWQPPLGPIVPVLAALAGAAVIAWLVMGLRTADVRGLLRAAASPRTWAARARYAVADHPQSPADRQPQRDLAPQPELAPQPDLETHIDERERSGRH